MARQSSRGSGRSSSSHGYRVTSPVATDRRKSPDSSQPQRTPSFPVKAIWPLDHTGGPDGYIRFEFYVYIFRILRLQIPVFTVFHSEFYVTHSGNSDTLIQ